MEFHMSVNDATEYDRQKPLLDDFRKRANVLDQKRANARRWTIYFFAVSTLIAYIYVWTDTVWTTLLYASYLAVALAAYGLVRSYLLYRQDLKLAAELRRTFPVKEGYTSSIGFEG